MANQVEFNTLPEVKRFAVGGYVSFVANNKVHVGRVIPGSGADYAAIELVDGTETEVLRVQCRKVTPAIHAAATAGEAPIHHGLEFASDEEDSDVEDELLDAIDDEEAEDDEEAPRDVVKRKYKDRYKEKSPSGRDCNDKLASKLRDCDLEAVYRESANHGFDPAELKVKYAHLNRGLQRMTVGNLIRQAIKRGE